ncbi:hypothetical protein CC79DRAFT_1372537 [Sarocladium strictum]
MASTMLPFLYQTRTLQRLTRTPIRRQFSRTARAAAWSHEYRHESIPFEGLPDESDGRKDQQEDGAASADSTMTPNEAEVFKSIFEDISKGRMPRPSTNRTRLQDPQALSGSLVEQARQARLSNFRENVLQRFPSSLRQAAETALDLYEFEPGTSDGSASTDKEDMRELAEKNARLLQEKEACDKKRKAEMGRLDARMNVCMTDAELWKVLEEEVFILPAKLGIAVETPSGKTKKGSKKGKKAKKDADIETTTKDEPIPEAKYSMDVYGPLYSHLLLRALDQFDTHFALPSLNAFNILPKVKSIGIHSYVLGVSTAFYARLARMHWDRYGDATSALEMLEEMNSIGLQPDMTVHDLLVRIRDELQACASGDRGAFVAAVVESPPYDAALLQRLEDMEIYVRDSLMDPRGEFSS